MEAGMEKEYNLDELTRTTRKLEFDDGLVDLQNGLVFLLIGLLGALTMSTTGIELYMRGMLFNPEITTIVLLALIPLFVLVTFGLRRLIKHYRRKVLWREMGVVEPFHWQVQTRFSLLAGLVWLVVVIAGWVLISIGPSEFDAGIRVFISASGVATGVIYFAMGRSLHIERYLWVGAVAGGFSGLIMLLPLKASAAWLVFGLIWVIMLGISGSLGLHSSLKRLRARAQ
jgi:hypothetical protein